MKNCSNYCIKNPRVKKRRNGSNCIKEKLRNNLMNNFDTTVTARL